MKNFSDQTFIRVALQEGAKALRRGDFPVGAALVINGKIVGKTNNALLSQKTWGDHAETQLLLRFSQTIRKQQQKNVHTKVELYSTLEPCLMCLGCAMLHRVNRIIFSCPDPRGGATNVTLKGLPSFYHDKWPEIKSGIYKEEAFSMLLKFMTTQDTKQWKNNKKLFEKMAASWN